MDTMLRKALRKYNGLRQQLDNVLLGDDGDRWEAELKNFLAKRPCWIDRKDYPLIQDSTSLSETSLADTVSMMLSLEKSTQLFVGVEDINGEDGGVLVQVDQLKSTSPILEFVSTVVVSATDGKFVAKEKFVRDTGDKTKVKISDFGENFTNWFLNGEGKIEYLESVQTLGYHKLLRQDSNGRIITELGGTEKSKTMLSDTFSLMKNQKNGEDGVLLNNSFFNIFYIPDQTGVLRAVYVRWRGDGWFVGAYSVEDPNGWNNGDRVFSRNLNLSFSEHVLASGWPLVHY